MYTYFNKGCFGNCALVFESHLIGGHSSKALHFIMRFNDQIYRMFSQPFYKTYLQ